MKNKCALVLLLASALSASGMRGDEPEKLEWYEFGFVLSTRDYYNSKERSFKKWWNGTPVAAQVVASEKVTHQDAGKQEEVVSVGRIAAATTAVRQKISSGVNKVTSTVKGGFVRAKETVTTHPRKTVATAVAVTTLAAGAYALSNQQDQEEVSAE